MIAVVLHSNSRMPQDSQGRDAGYMMLLVDTCGASGSLALARVGAVAQVIGEDVLPGRSASERLMPAIRSLLEVAGVPLGELGAIAVVHGPGSFTGVRIGISAVKGLCEALDIPVIAISRLAVLAGKAPDEGAILALLDAGRGEMYAGEYAGTFCVGEALRTREEVLAMVQSRPVPVVVACEPSIADLVPAVVVRVVPELTASDALALAAGRFLGGGFDDVASLDANYVRRTDAEIFAKPAAVQGRPR